MTDEITEHTTRGWDVQRDVAEATALFAKGTPVRHLNPTLSDWRGTVVPTQRSGQYINSGDPHRPTVRVAWHAGTDATDDDPVVGWYSAWTIEPDPES